MDVRINCGPLGQKPTGKATPSQKSGATSSFSELLRSAGPRSETERADEDFSTQTAEQVFERVFTDRDHPDLNRLDEYMEWRIRQEQKGVI